MNGSKPGFKPGRLPGFLPGGMGDVVTVFSKTVDVSSTGYTTLKDDGLEGEDGKIYFGSKSFTFDVDPDGGTVDFNIELNGEELFSSDKSYNSSGTHDNTPDQNNDQEGKDHEVKINVKSSGGSSASVTVTGRPEIQ